MGFIGNFIQLNHKKNVLLCFKEMTPTFVEYFFSHNLQTACDIFKFPFVDGAFFSFVKTKIPDLRFCSSQEKIDNPISLIS